MRHRLVVCGNGVPLVIHAPLANASDQGLILSAVAGFLRVIGGRGRPRGYPDILYEDCGNDSEATRDALRA